MHNRKTLQFESEMKFGIWMDYHKTGNCASVAAKNKWWNKLMQIKIINEIYDAIIYEKDKSIYACFSSLIVNNLIGA